MDFGTMYEAFVSEFVEVYTKSNITLSSETDEGRFQSTEPITIKAFLVDIDAERLYLGPAPDVIDEWVDLTSVWRIKIIVEEDLTVEALKSMPMPQTDEEIN